MEYGDNKTSDSNKDDEMKRSFESISDKREKSEKKEKKPEKRKKIPLFIEKPTDEEKKDQKTEPTEISEPSEKVSKEKLPAVENSETETPSEKMTDEERAEAASTYIEAVEQDARDELNNAIPESLEEAESAASVLFLEQLSNQVNNNNDINEEIIDDALQVAARELGIEPEIVKEDEAPTENNVDKIELDNEVVENNIVDDSQPPAPPVRPTSPRTDDHDNIPPIISNVNFNTRPSTENINPQVDDQLSNVFERRQRSRDLLIGGLIGYMIGRRGGRKRTEKRLVPIQKKLEKEVKNLHQTIANKEMEIRSLAAKQFETKGQYTHKQTEKIKELKEQSKNHNKKTPKSESLHNDVVYDRENETTKIDQKSGHDTVESNYRNPLTTEKAPVQNIESIETKEKKLSPKAVAQLNLPMLLSVAEGVPVEHSNLKSLYDRKLITQSELREGVKAYLEGEKVEFSIKERSVGEELQYEQSQNMLDENHIKGVTSVAADNSGNVFEESTKTTTYQANEEDSYKKMAPDVRVLFENPYKDNSKNQSRIAVVTAIVFGIGCIVAILIFT